MGSDQSTLQNSPKILRSHRDNDSAFAALSMNSPIDTSDLPGIIYTISLRLLYCWSTIYSSILWTFLKLYDIVNIDYHMILSYIILVNDILSIRNHIIEYNSKYISNYIIII